MKQHNLHLYLVLSSSTTLPKVLMVLYCQTIKTLMGESGKKTIDHFVTKYNFIILIPFQHDAGYLEL